MDYDRTDIPAGYDRARDHGPEFLELWMHALERHFRGAGVRNVLDLGCGTGRFSDALATYFGADVVGIDPSVKMLEQARTKPHRGRVEYRLGSAEAISLPSNSIDAIFISMSFHHFNNRALVAHECRRVLRNGGRICVRTGTREQIPSYAYVPFFPAALSKLQEVLPDRAAICRPFEAAGFRLLSEELIVQTIAGSWNEYADKLAAGGDSVLATLNREEFDEGLAALRRHREHVGREGISEPIDLLVFG